MAQGWLQIVVFLIVLLTALVPLLGTYIAKVFQGERVFLSPVVGPVERFSLPAVACAARRGAGLEGATRARCVVFSLLSWLLLYLILRTQSIQPFNPEGFGSGPWNLSFNTASSFVTNTNWQYYGGETTLSYFAQMAGLTVQNFVSAAVGIAVLAAVIRGFAARSASCARQLLDRPDPDHPLHAAADLLRRGAGPRLPGRDPDPRRLSSFHTLAGGTPDPRASGRSPRRRRSRSSAPTAAASSTSTAPIPFENPNGLTNIVELLPDAGDPGQPHLHLRPHDRQPPPGLGALRGDDGDVRRRGRGRLRRRAARQPRPAPRRRRHPRLRRLDRRQHGGQGAALRDRRVLAVDGGHHRHLLRRGQRRLRLADRDRRPGPDRQPLDRRGDLRRGRLRPLLHAAASSC